MYYDPLGRVVKTVNPDRSEQRVVYGVPNSLNTPNSFAPTPWENFTYDSNDLASITNPTGSNVPATDYFTPKSAEVDALGRTIKTTEYFDNSNYNNTIVMQYHYDIRGNLLLVKDPYNRNVFEHVYDLRTPQEEEPLPPLWTKHIDKGESTVLFDALAKPIESHDAKGARGLSAYDTLQRPTHSWANNKTGDATTLRNFLEYGDSAGLVNPENENLKGKLYKNYDEAGLIEMPEYDFKGNVLTKKRQVISSAVLKAELVNYNTFVIDWTGLPTILDATVFETTMNYDALNRITELELPEDLDNERKKIIPTYNNAGALEKVDLYSPTGPTTTNYVENIAYNAKGQRLLIAFGNEVMTRYVYDPFTFRLQRQRSEKYVKSQTGNTITYAYQSGTNKQDDKFNYDLIGNIVNIFTRVTDCGISPLPDELDRSFEYDPIYRLTYADGRESDTQSGNNYLYTDAPVPGTPNANNARAYQREYAYDKLGNILQVKQLGTNGFTRDFTYNTGKNTLQKVDDATPTLIEAFTYDNCGNQLTAGTTRNYKWNYADQLICYYNQAGISDPTVFTQYDYASASSAQGAGQDRVSKLVRTGTAGSPIYERTIYIDGIFEYVILENGTTYEKNYIHIMDDKSRIAEVRINPGNAFPGDITDDVTYIIENQIGSSVARLSTTGTIIDKEEYYPFGDSSLRTFTYKRYRYVSKEKDAESGLYYYGARYYAAWTCRFITVDPLASKFSQLSPYNYSSNSPVGQIDIDGMQNPQQAESKQGGNGGSIGGGQMTNHVTLDEVEVTATKIEKPLAASTSNPTPTPAGAWKVKNEWNDDYIKKFQDYSASKTKEYSNLGKQFTCEDLALSIVIDFASENNLPFQFTNETGTFNPTDAIYTSVAEYKNAVLRTSGANDLANNKNTTEVSIDKAKQGDMILLKTHDDSIKYNHTQVITKITDTQTEISQGNLNYRILSQDPSSTFYGGVDIQEGAYFKDNSYFNKSKMEYHTGDFLTQNRASIRTWNFISFNKR
ncbi:MAG: RHS repeat protein [Sphingobacteriaceae bacterium]|nr:RHS repeat protein [Sphingobacteriaceae bacterium]